MSLPIPTLVRPSGLCAVILVLLVTPPLLGASELHPDTSLHRPFSDQELEGQVVDARSPHHPIQGLRVRAIPGEETVTDAEGRFRIRTSDARRVRLLVDGFGVTPLEMEVDLPLAAPLRLEVTRLFRLDELVATATPTGRSTTYQPTQALGPDQLQERLASSIGSMLDGEPGIAMRSLGAAPTRPVIRGFDGDRVLVLENGERMGDLAESAADHAVAMDPLALRRVEVVRGPASLLYGSSALGGVVNLLTTDLPERWAMGWGGTLHTHAASMNRSAAAGGEVRHGREDWVATGRLSFRESGDIRTPEARLPGTSLSSRDGQVGVVREAGDLRMGFSASFVDRSYGIPDAIDDPEEDALLIMERQALQGRLDWTPSAPGWIERVDLRANVARFIQEELARELAPGGVVMEEVVALEFDQYAGSATATLRHTPFGPFDSGAWGVAYRFRTLDVGGEEAFTPGVREGAIALFTFQEIPLTPEFRLQFGARGEHQGSRARANDFFPDARDRRSSTTFSGSAGVNWRPTSSVEMGAQVARAHRTPSVEELYADGPHLGAGAYEIGTPDLEDEIGHGVDLFLRRGWTRGGVEVALFYNRISGFVAFQPQGRIDEASGLPIFRYEGTDARLLGGELMGEFRISEALELGAGIDWVRGDRLGGETVPLPTIPPFRGRISARWNESRWWAAGTLRAVASQNRVAEEEDPTGGYALLDGSAGFRVDPPGNHTIVLRVENATNRLYRDHLSRVEERGFPMPARNLSLIYRWSF